MPTPSPLFLLPESKAERWALLSELISHWFGPSKEEDGFGHHEFTRCEQRLGVQLPAAMREWYAIAGRREDIWSCQDTLLSPDKIKFVADVLEFYVENQYVTSWGIRRADLSQGDPPVVVRDEVEDWVVQSPRLSEFALHMLAFSTQFAQRLHQVHGYAHQSCVERVVSTLPRLGLPEFIWTRGRLFGYRDLVVAVDGTDHMTASGVSAEALDPFRQLINVEDFEIIHESDRPFSNLHRAAIDSPSPRGEGRGEDERNH